MRGLSLVLCALSLLSISFATDDGLTDRVSWDKYSLMVEGKRVFIFAGEFHYQRLPVPELWLDVLEKFKAHGMNAVSIYFFWSYHSPRKGVYDLKTGARDVQKLLDMAKKAGLYVIARPGPYCNAETNAGGLALWTTDGSGGRYRTGDQKYHDAWLPWVQEISAVLKKNQITAGGPVILHQIENELQQTTYSADHTLVKYMESLKKAFREAGIVVPFTHNEKGMRSMSWSTDYKNVGGAVDVYGLDSYPGGMDCANPDKGFKLVRNYYEWFSNYSFTQPGFQPEFQAGWFQPWGGSFYDKCEAEHDPAFADVYYKNNIAQRVTLLALYMAYGGTNWGHSAAPVVYSSYDYSAPLRETRQIQDKFKQTKLLALFTRVSVDLLKTNLEAHGTSVAAVSKSIYTWVLRNPDTKAGFYILQQNDSRSRQKITTSISLETSAGIILVSNVGLDGRQSKILVSDYKFGDMTLLYSSAEILTYGLFETPVLVFYLKAGQYGEFSFKVDGPVMAFKTYGERSNFASQAGKTQDGKQFMKYIWTQAKGSTVIKFQGGSVVYLLDILTAWKFFAPSLTLDPNTKPSEQVFVLGPYLVRNASVSDEEVMITGDSNERTSIEVFVGSKALKINWNGKLLETRNTDYGSLIAQLPGPATSTVKLPQLSEWKVEDSLPEIESNFDDSKWTVCDKQSTQSPIKPLSLPVLYSSDYSYHSGIKIYRGRFNGNFAVRANITVQAGVAAGWSAWLNGKYVGGSLGKAGVATTSEILDLATVVLSESVNILTIVTDYHGHDQTSVRPFGPQNPRGILGARLYSKDNKELKFAQWKIQGNAGGTSEIDKVRGPMNEGGLYGERLGWHLPGFDTTTWKAGSPSKGIAKAGVAWYTTKFELNIDTNLDVPLGIELNAPAGTTARVQIFINGYQYGKYVPHIGPQTRFPLQPGVVNNQGQNTLAISLWAQDDKGAKLSEVNLIQYGVYETGANFSQDWKYLQPGWTKERLLYA